MCDLIQNRQVSQVYLIVYEGLQIGFPDVNFQFFFYWCQYPDDAGYF